MRGRLVNRALTASDRYRVFAQSHQTHRAVAGTACPSTPSVIRRDEAHHAMPLWSVWVCVHKHKQAQSQKILNVTPKLDYE